MGMGYENYRYFFPFEIEFAEGNLSALPAVKQKQFTLPPKKGRSPKICPEGASSLPYRGIN